jgi:ribosome-binding factor A
VKVERLERAIARDLADLFPMLKDPRVPLIITIEQVKLSADGRKARVLVSTLTPEDNEAMLTALNRASGYLQHELAERLSLRFTPKLSFHTDLFEVLG